VIEFSWNEVQEIRKYLNSENAHNANSNKKIKKADSSESSILTDDIASLLIRKRIEIVEKNNY
jgi:hypothetical protein